MCVNNRCIFWERERKMERGVESGIFCETNTTTRRVGGKEAELRIEEMEVQ